MLLSLIYKSIFRSRYKGLMRRLNDASEHQKSWMLRLVQEHQHTEIGKRYQFNAIKDYDSFKQNIPVRCYEDIAAEIESTMAGKQNIFSSKQITTFGKSSGTTGKSKYIPLTREAIYHNHFLGGKDMLTMYLHQYKHSHLFTGKNLVISGSFENRDKIEVGDISAHIVKNLPFWIMKFRVPSIKVALEKDWNFKMHRIVEEALQQKIVALSGVPSWMMVVLQKMKDEPEFSRKYWKDIEVFFHGGIHFEPLKNKFNELIEKDIRYFQIYNATEGFFGIQEQPGTVDMLLMTHHGVFYEFAPIIQQKPCYEKIVDINGVEVGKSYEMVITTNAGLWRYALGDVVDITQKNPVKIIIIGRTKQYINMFGEELMVHNAELAIAAACVETHAVYHEYTVAPLLLEKEKGCHEWWIEFETMPPDMEVFRESLDKHLKELNSDYEAKRAGDLLLQKPFIKVLPAKTFHKWLAGNKKLGGQNKVSKLKNDRSFVEDLVKFAT